MAMTVAEIRASIQTLCEQDNEMRSIYVHLDQMMDWPINETFNLMVLIEELKKRMKDDVVHFTFKKKDGSIRQAYGTRANDVLIQRDSIPGDNGHARGTFPYFDIERQAWRCFKVETLMDIDRGYTI